MATYQSILLHLIFALLRGKEKAFDLSLRYRIQPDEHELLVALVQSCRRLGMLSYPNILAHHEITAPLALVWVSVEEIKRFGLALYKVCRMCSRPESLRRNDKSLGSELLTLSDLNFCMPDSDELWNAPGDAESGTIRRVASHTNLRDNGNPDAWISRASCLLYDEHVDFDWI
ncbi:hypothetical protein PHISCL_02332 [Aspergillus sclerotialis]|uniref:Uncharacterized protein n=1 Tax=Aspergillus sclerotialis TaxID=2070753 RepID=A0A3A2ZSL5_9EURO|nr:hypothetical protein PHISCL_02332 [Aspergillus sclerotialis]